MSESWDSLLGPAVLIQAAHRARLDALSAGARPASACADLRFNLQLDDPLARYLSDEGWQGAGGEYVVTLGAESSARAGPDAALPTLTASVGAPTRLWLGVGPATGLAMTGGLSGPPELIRALDQALSLPPPRPDWRM